MSARTDAGPGVPADPFPQYDTEEEVTSQIGAGGGSVATHEAASDPHPQYDTAAEVATRVTTHEGTAAVHNHFLDVTLSPYNADNTGVVEATTAIQAAITAAGETGTVYIPKGSYLIDQLVVNPSGAAMPTIRGDGPEKTRLIPKTGATSPIISVSPSTVRHFFEMSDLEVWMEHNAVTGTGIELHNLNQSYFRNVKVRGGTVGWHIKKVQSTKLDSCQAWNASTAGFQLNDITINGLIFENCYAYLQESAAGDVNALFEILAANEVFISNCHFLRAPGITQKANYGTKITFASFANAYIFISNSVLADSITDLTDDSATVAGLWLQNVGNIHVSNSWISAFSNSDNTTNPAMKLDASRDLMFTNNWISGRGVTFQNSPDTMIFSGNVFSNANTTGMFITSSGTPVNLVDRMNIREKAGIVAIPVADDMDAYITATRAWNYAPVWTNTVPPSDAAFNSTPPPGTLGLDEAKARLHARNSDGFYGYADLTVDEILYLSSTTNADVAVGDSTTTARLRETPSGITYTAKGNVTSTTDATSFATTSFGPGASSRDYLVFVMNLRSSSPTAVNSITHTSIGSLSEIATLVSDDGKARLSVWKGVSTGTTSGALTVDFGGVTQSACAIRPYELTGDVASVSTFATSAGTKSGTATASPLSVGFGLEPTDHSVIGFAGKVGSTASVTTPTGYSAVTSSQLADSLGTYAFWLQRKTAVDSSFMWACSGSGEVFGIAVKVLLPTVTPTLSGFTGGVDGRPLTVENVSTQDTITLKHQTGSSSANQLTLSGSADLALAPGGTAELIYDEASSKWVAAASSVAPIDADYLVGTASSTLTGEIVVGTSPGGELGGTWASPTVDATHSGSAHLTLGTSPSTQAFADAAAGGSATDAAKTDHKHGMPSERSASSSTPAAVGTAAVGTGTTDARADHVHATGAGTPSTQAMGDAAATGSGPAASMTDHKHALGNLSGNVTTSGSQVTTIASAVVTGPMLAVNVAPRPNTNSLLGWSEDPTNCATGRTPAAAIIYLRKIMVPTSITIANVLLSPSTAGTNYSNAQAGLYNSSGTLLGTSAVMATGGTDTFGSGVPKVTTHSLSAESGQSLAITGGETTYVWAALHMGTNSSTAAIFAGASGSAFTSNAGLAAATARGASATGHATNSLHTIGNLTPSGFNITNSVAFIWMGVS